MTLHIFYDHQCPKCKAHYIPYDKDIPCPRCGLVEKERFDYIPQAAESVKFNLERYGQYMPPAWYTGSLGDRVLFILFSIFEQCANGGDKADFPTFAYAVLSSRNWGDQDYLRKHICSIAVRVNELLQDLSATQSSGRRRR